jgi:hypothetical protein
MFFSDKIIQINLKNSCCISYKYLIGISNKIFDLGDDGNRWINGGVINMQRLTR